MLPIEGIDNGLSALASEMGLLSVAEECPTLQKYI